MSYLGQIRDKIKLILIDAVVLAIVPILALLLRYEGAVPEVDFLTFRSCLLWMVLINLGIFYFYGLYHRIWHYARIRDLVAIVGAVTLAQAVIFIVTMLAEIPVPRSVIILTWLRGTGISAIKVTIKIKACASVTAPTMAIKSRMRA